MYNLGVVQIFPASPPPSGARVERLLGIKAGTEKT